MSSNKDPNISIQDATPAEPTAIGPLLATMTNKLRESRQKEMLHMDPLKTLTSRECDRCGGGGKHRLDVPIDDPDYLLTVECDCAAGRVLKQRRIDLCYRYAGVSKDRREWTLQSFKDLCTTVDQLHQKADAIHNVSEYVAHGELAGKSSLFLYGEVGVGKTGLSLAMVNLQVLLGERARFVNVPRFLNMLRRSFSEEDRDADAIRESIEQAPFVVLDDIGAHKATAWTGEVLYLIMDERLAQSRRTIYTSNHSYDELVAELGGDDSARRIVDRMREHTAPVQVGGKSFRGLEKGLEEL